MHHTPGYMIAIHQGKKTSVPSLMWSVCLVCVVVAFSLKDDDSGDHDQDQGSPKDCEKEKIEDEDKEQNTAKKKVSFAEMNRK